MQIQANIHFNSKHYSGACQQESKSRRANFYYFCRCGKSTKAHFFGELWVHNAAREFGKTKTFGRDDF